MKMILLTGPERYCKNTDELSLIGDRFVYDVMSIIFLFNFFVLALFSFFLFLS